MEVWRPPPADMCNNTREKFCHMKLFIYYHILLEICVRIYDVYDQMGMLSLSLNTFNYKDIAAVLGA